MAVMIDNVAGIRGEYRRLSPAEIGLMIRLFRGGRGIKRGALSADAHVSEKTNERAEHGESIAEESRKRIAKALSIDEEALIRELYVPTTEEAEQLVKQQTEERERTHSAVAIRELRAVRDVLPLFESAALFGDSQYVQESHLRAFAELKQSLVDWSDIAGDISEPQRIDAAESLLREVRDLEVLGYVVKAGIAARCLKGGSPFPCTVLVAFPRPKG